MDWTQSKLKHTDILVGPCAWRLPMLTGPDKGVVQNSPSLIVVDPGDSDEVLAQAAPALGDLPVLLGIDEPDFARQLEGNITRRIQHLQRERVDALVLHVQDPAEIKSGGVLQTMFTLRDRGIVGCLGLAHPDASVAEWLSINAAVRLLGVSYSLDNQQARYRTIGSANDYGMSCVALGCPADDKAVSFALSQRDSVLPVLNRTIPKGLSPLSEQEAQAAWQAYQQNHPPPPPLPRGRPPMLDPG